MAEHKFDPSGHIVTCYTGYPKDLGPSRYVHFPSEREFIKLLHEGYPMVVAFTIRGNCTRHLDRVLEEAAVEFYPNVKFILYIHAKFLMHWSFIFEECSHPVECPKYPGLCIARQRKEYPFIEIFRSPEQGRVADPNVTRYNVKVLPLNYDLSAYGFREFFKRHGILASDPK